MSHRRFDLLLSMGHTLRTPLNQIVGASEILQQAMAGELNKRQKKQVSGVSAAGTELLDVVGDLIELAELEPGTATVAATRCDIAPAIHAAVAQIRPHAYKKRITLATYSDERSASTNADPDWIRRLFVTVVSNAVAIAEPRSMITINFDAAEDIRGPDTNLRVTIRVHQSCLAAPEAEDESTDVEELAALYERHAQGFGLRLALAHAIARQHGGSVRELRGDAASHSLTFAVTLPAGGAHRCTQH